MPQAENTALARSHSSITTRKTILGSRQQCFWNEGKKKNEKRSHQFQFHCGVLQTSTAQRKFSCPPCKSEQERFREIQEKFRTLTHTCTTQTS